ncbi:hypothetical protein PR003_g9300 [Phytophthora rubi]|uniref:Secreted protein n=1 Tax=Phytophthora rubi TaxID=129364 RepID=A0A6A4FH52_9STRA|nr:hypothetical protein PR002_g9028 [Phytophthora rubi]KAE9035578.1 hypothetical protein PR001_g9241 [Phytophthora rubi]KAE9342783.1 hypothetical protein PR003_g9300 [Phytophthora rubi]
MYSGMRRVLVVGIRGFCFASYCGCTPNWTARQSTSLCNCIKYSLSGLFRSTSLFNCIQYLLSELVPKPTNTLMIGQKHQLTKFDWTKTCTCVNVLFVLQPGDFTNRPRYLEITILYERPTSPFISVE